MNKNYINLGLTSDEVNTRIGLKQTNYYKHKESRSYKDIIITNTFNPFNALNFILAIIVLFTGQYRNMLFMGVVIFNTAIGIFQEVRAKHQLDKLRLLNEPHAKVLRDGKEIVIDGSDIVIDDLLVLSLGNQILSDAILEDGHIEVNEALLTGESNNIIKSKGDILYAGSFVVAGNAKCRIIHVGENNYINHILNNVKKEKHQPSRLKDALNFIIKCISYIILPLGILLFSKQFFVSKLSLNDSLIQTVASMVGMIPEGLILLTSVALSIGCLKLSRNKTLVQELYSLETLARTDVLCLDKTGTLTKGEMIVEDVIKFHDFDYNIIANIYHILNDQNPTAKAIRDYFKVQDNIKLDERYEFSSKKKYCGARINQDIYKIGAYNFVVDYNNQEILQIINKYTNEGCRVLTIAKNNLIIGLILIEDVLRDNVNETIDYFKKQGVDLKVISGDDPKTVSNICFQCGIVNYDKYVDCSKLSDDEIKDKILTHTVFGRVTPDQKCLMIKILKENNHTVGMVGDGVNDVMALKEADFSISVLSGADSAKNIANVVLLDDDFSHMPMIVNEGRRVINNIQRTSTLFLSKTVLSILLTIATIFILKEYPFAPIQLTLISSLCIGLPSFVLSLEPKYEIIKGNFLANVLNKAIPLALAIIFSGLILEILVEIKIVDRNAINTMYTIITATILIFTIYSISKPLNALRIALIIFSITGIFLAYICYSSVFYFIHLNLIQMIITLILILIAIFSLKYIDKLKLAERFANKIDNLY